MAGVSVKAFAKINLSLGVTGRLENGYHLIRSVMQAIDIHDDITVETKGKAGLYGGTSIKIQVEDEIDKDSDVSFDIPEGENNIMYRAAAAMADYFCPVTGNRVNLRLVKRIPMAAGLAGGSTDAAAVMLALARLWAVDVKLATLVDIGKSIGADVPFCLAANAKLNPTLGFAGDILASSCALAEGIGETLTPRAGTDGAVVLVKPDIAVSTPYIYGLFDKNGQTDGIASPEDMVNALEPVTVGAYPLVGDTIERLKGLVSPERVFMSGSGPTVLAYFAERAAAESAAVRIKQAFKDEADGGCYVRFAGLM
ncbi:MAG: 4-(cytidine 5'-diphospho)-2-C-methyl-D-erythritol kinase [Clostridiales Family XIII bacterium]|jgi:4-diphosphocytidyl-2-C-methyl-D-erythritol kinase|nr:4-(cytidine 5'-diphospho)-2-C-methyl-D-erythritol kinase [Clostridiales Family XIII bacterium]